MSNPVPKYAYDRRIVPWLSAMSANTSPLLGRRYPIVVPRLTALLLGCILLLTACGSRESEEERHREANTPAGKVGQAAHKVAIEADKAGRVIGRHLDKAAHDAHEGWKESARKDSTHK